MFFFMVKSAIQNFNITVLSLINEEIVHVPVDISVFFFGERIDIIKNFICEKLVRYLLADKLNSFLISKEGYRT